MTSFQQNPSFQRAIESAAEKSGIRKDQIECVLTYGSRVTGGAREDSDFDVLVIARSKSNLVREYHTHCSSDFGGAPLDLRIFSSQSLRNEIRKGHLAKSRTVLEGKTVFGRRKVARRFKKLAANRVEAEIHGLKQELLAVDPSQIINTMRIDFTKAFKILLDLAATGQKVASFSRLSEFMIDYYIYSKYLRFLNDKDTLTDSDLAKFVYFRLDRPARFLDKRKEQTDLWFQRLVERIEKVYNCKTSLDKKLVESIFLILDGQFRDISGVSLLLNKSESCEVLFQ